MGILDLERSQILSFRRQSSVKSGKHQVTKMGRVRRRLWEICSGGREINETVFRERVWELPGVELFLIWCLCVYSFLKTCCFVSDFFF